MLEFMLTFFQAFFNQFYDHNQKVRELSSNLPFSKTRGKKIPVKSYKQIKTFIEKKLYYVFFLLGVDRAGNWFAFKPLYMIVSYLAIVLYLILENHRGR